MSRLWIFALARAVFVCPLALLWKFPPVFIAVREQKKIVLMTRERVCGAKKHKSPFNHIFSRRMMVFCALLCRSMLLFCCCCCCRWYFRPSNKCTFGMEINTFYGRNGEKPVGGIIWGLTSNYLNRTGGGERWKAFTVRFEPFTHSKDRYNIERIESVLIQFGCNGSLDIAQYCRRFDFFLFHLYMPDFYFYVPLKCKKYRRAWTLPKCEFSPIAFSFFLSLFLVNEFLLLSCHSMTTRATSKKDFWQQHFHNLLQYLLRLKSIRHGHQQSTHTRQWQSGKRRSEIIYLRVIAAVCCTNKVELTSD